MLLCLAVLCIEHWVAIAALRYLELAGSWPGAVLMPFIVASQPWILLLPNYVYTKPYYNPIIQKAAAKPFYISPGSQMQQSSHCCERSAGWCSASRYIYKTPSGMRTDVNSKALHTSPFIT